MRIRTAADVSAAIGIPFSDQQLAAITAPLEPGVIIAGAGSGKTTVMAARVVWLVGTGAVRPEQVLGLTFTRKAAAELSARVRSALLRAGVLDEEGVDEAGEQVVMTYDAFAARLVRDHGLRIGADGEPRTITGAARFRLASRVVASAPGPFEAVSRLRPDSVTERVLKLDGDLRAHLVATDEVRAHSAALAAAVEGAPRWRARVYASLARARAAALERAELAGLTDTYQALKAGLGVVEFADQMAVAAELAARVPEVSADLRSRFAVVLLDEYQDTSSAQADLLRALFSGDRPAEGRGHPVTAVGDPCQAIYGWRGAAASNIVTFARAFPRADGTPASAYALTVNRRSGQTILDAANELSLSLRGDPQLQWEGLERDLVAPAGTPPGDVAAAIFDTWPAEVAWVADRIAATHASGQVRRWSDIAVLTRRNEHIGAVYGALVDRNVPVEIVGLGGLLTVPEVADVVSVLRVLADVTDNPALVRILTGPRWAIGPADLAALGRRARELAPRPPRAPGSGFAAEVRATLAETEASAVVSLAEALDDLGPGGYSAEGRDRLAACAAELRGLRRFAGEPVTDLVRRVVAALGLEVEVTLGGPDGARQLDAFAAAVADYTDVDGDGSLGGLIAWLDAEVRHGAGLDQALVSDEDSVKLMTIHKAKGLEWDAVFLPALADRVFPSDRATDNWLTSSGTIPSDLRGDAGSVPQLGDVTDAATKEYTAALKDELRRGDDRLAYVAVTRARQHLVATSHAWAPEKQNARTPSPYLRVLQRHGPTLVAEEPSETNPLGGGPSVRPWPQPLDAEAFARRAEAAARVEAHRGAPRTDAVTTLDDEARLAEWDAAASVLVAEARAARRREVRVALPRYLSATGLVALRRDPEGFAAGLARPMPGRPAPAARTGEAFHAWLERRFSSTPTLVEPDEDADAPDAALADLVAAFERGRFAARRPAAVEVPFALVLGGQVVRGRIDAVYTDEGAPEVIDFKTGAARSPDPLQLAVYRLAWSELHGLPVEGVGAAFYDVLSDRVIRPASLPDRAALERLVTGLTADP